METQSLFTRVPLTEAQNEAAAELNSLQKARLQNLMAAIAEEKVWLSFDPKNPQDFIAREAEMRGQLLLLQQLIEGN